MVGENDPQHATVRETKGNWKAIRMSISDLIPDALRSMATAAEGQGYEGAESYAGQLRKKADELDSPVAGNNRQRIGDSLFEPEADKRYNQ